ncbi:hypothetical protein EVAR_77580_1 [Eumeta japonica]|uniref:Uncharacterized protein n=1 Tax=Eumeta variegata TaxID=151549 RepID=A0A4C1T9T1_EUMVA|nr:hypothetical protein EVAR_77580_1 [Eumeta japonica]
MKVESNPIKEYTKQPAAVHGSEKFDSDSDPGRSDVSDDHSDFPAFHSLTKGGQRRPPLPKSLGGGSTPYTESLSRAPRPLPVLVCSTAETNDKATKAAFFKIKSVLSLSEIKAEQPLKRALPAQYRRNKDTDSLPACVLSKQKGDKANYIGCPRAPKRVPPPEKAAPRRAPACAAQPL